MRTSYRYLVLLILFAVTLWTAGCEKAKQERIKVGDPAPQFRLSTLDGGTASLADYQGHPVILRFWSTECKYCRADTPIFNQYFIKYKDKGLKVVYINTLSTNDQEVRDFVKDLDIQFPVALDSLGKVAASYNVRIVPQTIILDPQHKIISGILGGVSEAELQELLQPYL